MQSIDEYQRQQNLKETLRRKLFSVCCFELMDEKTREAIRTAIEEFEEQSDVPRGTFAIRSIVFNREETSVTVTLKNRWVFTIGGMIRV